MTGSILGTEAADRTERQTVRSPDRAAEASHRIANQLVQLVALLEKQIDALREGRDQLPRAAAVDALRLHHGRLLGIARLHRAMSQRPHENVALQEVLPEFFREILGSGVFEDRLRLEWTLAEDCVVGPAQASAIMLVFSEILTNAMKYAHPTRLPVELTVVATPIAEGGVALVVGDDGVGLPDGFDEARDAGVGLKLVRSLIESVGGRVRLFSNELGLTFHLELPPP